MVTGAPLRTPFVDKIGNGGDFIGLVGNMRLRQDQPGACRVGAERVQGFQALAPVVRTPGGLAIDGDEVMAIRPQGANPVVEAFAEQNRIDPVDRNAQPALTGNAEAKL